MFVLGGHLVPRSVAYNLLILVAEGATQGEDEEQDRLLRTYAVDHCFKMLQGGGALSDVLVEVVAWLLGEYAYLLGREEEALLAICDLLERYSIIFFSSFQTKQTSRRRTHTRLVAHGANKTCGSYKWNRTSSGL